MRRRAHWLHAGFVSSHFTLRDLHVIHPVLVLLRRRGRSGLHSTIRYFWGVMVINNCAKITFYAGREPQMLYRRNHVDFATYYTIYGRLPELVSANTCASQHSTDSRDSENLTYLCQESYCYYCRAYNHSPYLSLLSAMGDAVNLSSSA